MSVLFVALLVIVGLILPDLIPLWSWAVLGGVALGAWCNRRESRFHPQRWESDEGDEGEDPHLKWLRERALPAK